MFNGSRKPVQNVGGVDIRQVKMSKFASLRKKMIQKKNEVLKGALSSHKYNMYKGK